MCVPILSTNTNRLPSSLPNVERHTSLSHSSISLLPTFFRLCPKRLITRQTIASLTLTPRTAKRNSLLCL